MEALLRAEGLEVGFSADAPPFQVDLSSFRVKSLR